MNLDAPRLTMPTLDATRCIHADTRCDQDAAEKAPKKKSKPDDDDEEKQIRAIARRVKRNIGSEDGESVTGIMPHALFKTLNGGAYVEPRCT